MVMIFFSFGLNMGHFCHVDLTTNHKTISKLDNLDNLMWDCGVMRPNGMLTNELFVSPR